MTAAWISAKDRQILREVAREAAAIGNHPRHHERAELWRRHVRLNPVRPMVTCSLAWELAPVTLTAEGEYARAQELRLRMRKYLWEDLRTDHILEPKIYSALVLSGNTWNIKPKVITPDTSYRGATRYEPVLNGTEDPILLELPRVTVDWEATEREHQKLCDLFGDILAVECQCLSYHTFEVTNEFVSKWRGMENFYLDVYERPQWVHAWLARLVQWWNSLYDQYEKLGLLMLNRTAAVSSGSPGGYVWTDELPQPDFDGTHVRTRDQWGQTDAEVLGGMVSAAMHEEFGLNYDKQVLARFGLAGYGCCEPLHDRIAILRSIPNLRRISVSPWADVDRAAAGIRDRYIFSYKPNPAIFAGDNWDLAAARRQLQAVLEKTRGCVVEIIMKDIQNYRNDPRRLKEWSAMAMDLVGAA